MLAMHPTHLQRLLISALNLKHGQTHPMSLVTQGICVVSFLGIVLNIEMSGPLLLLVLLAISMVMGLTMVVACRLANPIYLTGRYRYIVQFPLNKSPRVTSLAGNTIFWSDVRKGRALFIGFTPGSPIKCQIENGPREKRHRLVFAFQIVCGNSRGPTNMDVIQIVEWLAMALTEGERSNWSTVEVINFLLPKERPNTVTLTGPARFDPIDP